MQLLEPSRPSSSHLAASYRIRSVIPLSCRPPAVTPSSFSSHSFNRVSPIRGGWLAPSTASTGCACPGMMIPPSGIVSSLSTTQRNHPVAYSPIARAIELIKPILCTSHKWRLAPGFAYTEPTISFQGRKGWSQQSTWLYVPCTWPF